jgi:hypothetical protein
MLTQCLLCPAVVLQTWPNQNKKEEVERIKNVLLQQLQELRGAPGAAAAQRSRLPLLGLALPAARDHAAAGVPLSIPCAAADPCIPITRLQGLR